MNKVRKAIIPAAGLGTRFLPVTKALPKEMLPIIDTPTLQYIVEEAVESGINEIGIIVSMAKPSIAHHFSVNEELEKRLLKAGKNDEAKMIHDIAGMVKIEFILQEEPKGLGHAVLCAREFIGDEDFAIMLGDDLIINRDGRPVLSQMIDAYNETKSSVLGVKEVDVKSVSKYGIVDPIENDGKLTKIKGIIEKPSVENAPSRCAVLGRYILSNKIFDILENQEPGRGGEIQLTDAISKLIESSNVYAYEFDGVRYDIGDKFGFIKATIDFALEREDLREKVLEYLKKVAK